MRQKLNGIEIYFHKWGKSSRNARAVCPRNELPRERAITRAFGEKRKTGSGLLPDCIGRVCFAGMQG